MKIKSTLPILPLFAILFFGQPAHACSCAFSNESFVQLAQESQLVIRGKVLAYNWPAFDLAKQGRPISMTVEVKEVFKGSVRLSQITVWGDNGIQCRPYVTQFPIGTEWIWALSSGPSERSELSISICGEYSLSVQGNQVKGRIINGNETAKPQILSIPELRQRLKPRS